MRKLEKAVDIFCRKHPNFGVRNLMLYIIGGNVLAYIIAMMDRTGMFLTYLCFDPFHILNGEVWRLFTFIFIPTTFSSPLLLALAMYFYYFIGSTLERYWGKGKFTIFYFSGILLTIAFGFIVYIFSASGWIRLLYYAEPLSSYYVNMSMFFAFAALFPETRVLLFFFIPIKIKWLAYADAALFIFDIINMRAFFPMNLLPVVAFLNFFIFFASDIFALFKRNKTYQASPNVVNFRKEARNAQKAQDERGYRHKCAVCGRTDSEYPELEFRYCSRCAGYHCFCEEHINTHIHFTE